MKSHVPNEMESENVSPQHMTATDHGEHVQKVVVEQIT